MTVALASCLVSILQAGRVEEEQHAHLHSLLDGLAYCSVGVYVKEYETVITTDNLLTVGYVDLSICPVKLSVVGSVIARGVGYHDNVPGGRNPLPVDVVRSRSKHGVKCLLCVPIVLPETVLDGSTVASPRMLGTLTFGSTQANGLARRHRSIALKTAEAIAHDFVEATSSMYNNITDYVLGPMHGHDVPPSPAERPVPAVPQKPGEGCWDSSDSDDNDDDEGPTGMVRRTLDRSSVSIEAIAEPLPAVHSRLLGSSSSAGPQTAVPLPLQSTPWQPEQHQTSAVSLPTSGLPSSDLLLKHHSSPEESLDASHQVAANEGVGQHRQSSLAQSSDKSHLQSQSQLSAQPQSQCTEQISSSTLGHASSDTHRSLFARPLGLKDAARVASALSMAFFCAHCPPPRRNLQRVSSAKQKQSEAILDGLHPAHNPETARKLASGKSARRNQVGKVVDADSSSAPDINPVDYSQHRFILTFRDYMIEREYCVWQAKHRTKVQLCYALAIIGVAMCMAYVTPSADRNPLLWWPPLLQLVPVCAIACNRAWYCRHCEAMHIALNVLKTIWAVSVGVPCQGELWNSKRRLAVLWKFSMDNLVISGLGDLARFTIFMPVQALDLAIVTASSGALCKQAPSSQISPWHCVVLTLITHIFVAYFAIGSLVWYMDKQARKSFVMQTYMDQLARAASVPSASQAMLPPAGSGLDSLD